jgi:hypothetical protein
VSRRLQLATATAIIASLASGIGTVEAAQGKVAHHHRRHLGRQRGSTLLAFSGTVVGITLGPDSYQWLVNSPLQLPDTVSASGVVARPSGSSPLPTIGGPGPDASLQQYIGSQMAALANEIVGIAQQQPDSTYSVITVQQGVGNQLQGSGGEISTLPSATRVLRQDNQAGHPTTGGETVVASPPPAVGTPVADDISTTVTSQVVAGVSDRYQLDVLMSDMQPPQQPGSTAVWPTQNVFEINLTQTQLTGPTPGAMTTLTFMEDGSLGWAFAPRYPGVAYLGSGVTAAEVQQAEDIIAAVKAGQPFTITTLP